MTGIHLRIGKVYRERMAARTTPISGPVTDKTMIEHRTTAIGTSSVVALAVVFLLICAPGCEQRSDSHEATTSVAIATDSGDVTLRFLRPPDSKESMRLRETLFAGAAESRLARLKANDEDRIAIYAAWEQVLRANPTDPAIEKGVQPTATSLARFVGFVEGRLRVETPGWWQQHLQSALLFHQHVPEFRLLQEVTDQNLGLDRRFSAGLKVMPEIEIDQNLEGHVVVKKGADSCIVDKDVMRDAQSTHSVDSLAAAFADGTGYVGLHASVPWPYRLYAIDQKTGTEFWRAEVWAYGDSFSGAGNGGYHLVEIVVIDDDAVAIFGGGIECMYIEIFKRKDGLPLLRFGTSY